MTERVLVAWLVALLSLAVASLSLFRNRVVVSSSRLASPPAGAKEGARADFFNFELARLDILSFNLASLRLL